MEDQVHLYIHIDTSMIKSNKLQENHAYHVIFYTKWRGPAAAITTAPLFPPPPRSFVSSPNCQHLETSGSANSRVGEEEWADHEGQEERRGKGALEGNRALICHGGSVPLRHRLRRYL